MSGQKKNIFIFSSWYPNRRNPNSGSFIKEQVEALAELTSDRYNYIVSNWGFEQTEISLKEPVNAAKKIYDFVTTKSLRFYQENGIFYVTNRYLKFSEKLPYIGSPDRLANVQKKSIAIVEKELGPIDLIHAHVSYPAGYVSSLLSQFYTIPYLITEHMGPFPFDRYMKKGRPVPEIDQAVASAGQVIAVSNTLAHRMEKLGYCQPVVIPNMVDEECFLPGRKTRSKKTFRFLTLATMKSSKGIGDLLNAISIWSPRKDDVEFVIAGYGGEKDQFMNKSKELGIDNLVSWPGKIARKDVPAMMADCDAFVLPSHHESFGIVYVEAMACGRPVIATRCGGPEMIVNDKNGRLIPVGDPASLANALQWMYENSETFQPEQIRAGFMENYSKKAVTAQITDQYERLLGREYSLGNDTEEAIRSNSRFDNIKKKGV